MQILLVRTQITLLFIYIYLHARNTQRYYKCQRPTASKWWVTPVSETMLTSQHVAHDPRHATVCLLNLPRHNVVPGILTDDHIVIFCRHGI
jgi:hypothetical protein